MNKKTNLSHKAIRLLLNTSLARLEQPTLARLRDARAQALSRHRENRMVPALAWVENIAWPSAGTQYKPQLLAATALIIALLFSVAVYWPQIMEKDNTAVDISILTDDLPMHVYLD